MALTSRRRVVVNSGRRRSRANFKRKLTRAQVLAGFGGKRRQSAAKSSSHRKRTKSNSSAPRRRRRRNIGEILSVTLNSGHSGKKKGNRSMAATRKRRRRARHASAAPPRRRRRRANAGHRRRRHYSAAPVRRRRRSNTGRHRRRRANRSSKSSGGGVFSSITHIGVSLASAFGSKYLAQAFLGSNNTGFVGYIANGVATAAMAMVAKMFGYGRFVNAIIAGGAIQIGIRIVSDLTPYGSYLSQTGLGDYQASNWVTPQRYIDPMNSAQVEIPAGWAPKVIAPPAAGMSGWNGDYDGLYGTSGGGLYQ